ncbi:hypothetical protein F4825DRAFT_447099 [Nemania diffusa]|nr:hypothetical protein F4825DRAFT_447099 [Nemania diffusa]
MDQQPSAIAALPGLAPRESEEASPEDTERRHDLQSQILLVLTQLRDDQREYLSLQREKRWGLAHDIPRVAQELWESGTNAWEGLGHDSYWSILNPGTRFLEDSTNFQRARLVFDRWFKGENANPGVHSASWNRDYFVYPHVRELQLGSNAAYMWPDTWQILEPQEPWDYEGFKESYMPSCRSFVTCASPRTFRDTFGVELAHNEDFLDTLRFNRGICGIIAQFSVSRIFNVIDLDNAAAILAFVPGIGSTPEGNPEFLDEHIAEWRERPLLHRCGMRDLEIANNPWAPSLPPQNSVMLSGVFMHYMRSFTVYRSDEERRPKRLNDPGLKCLREHVTFQGFYDGTTTKLIERRYSTALGGDFHTQGRAIPWNKFGIYPAGLDTGISIFQLQICVFIELWEEYWTTTIAQIDETVSLKLNVLENVERLRNLVLGNGADASVLYFKVLQILNNFSDMVCAARAHLHSLSHNIYMQIPTDFWLEKSYPHTEATRNVLEHNWKIVNERQRDASNRIIAKLERTSNEVKSLQSGLFNVQSITEARKSRILNKYLTVFTIVTILFLPPTFVATFFGMHIFDADTITTTQKIFWVVLGALSGGTYLVAALGLWGSNLSADERKEWQVKLGQKVRVPAGNLAAWFENIPRRIRRVVFPSGYDSDSDY